MSEILTKEYLEKLQEALEKQDIGFIKEQVEELHYADITALAYELEEEEMSFLLCNLETEIASEVISELDEETRSNFFKKLSYQKLASYIDLMESDDAVDVLKEQDIQIREQIIATLHNREKARNIIHLLPYEQDTAGGLMAKEFIKATRDRLFGLCPIGCSPLRV